MNNSSGIAFNFAVLKQVLLERTKQFKYKQVAGGESITANCEVNDCVVDYGGNGWTVYINSQYWYSGFTAVAGVSTATSPAGSNSAIIVWKCTTAGSYTFTNNSSQLAGWFVYPI